MKLAKKITGIVLSSMMILVALFLLIVSILATTGMIDLIQTLVDMGSYAPEELGKQVFVYAAAIIVGIIVTIFAAVQGGKGLAKALKGKGEMVLNRAVLFTIFPLIPGAALLFNLFTNFEYMKDEAGKYITIVLFLVIFAIGAAVVGTIGRRKVIGKEQSKLAGGILLAVTFTLMLVMLIMFASSDELKAMKYVCKGDQVDAVDGIYGALTAFGYLGSFGVLAFAALNIVEFAIWKHKQPKEEAKEEEPKEEPKEE